MSYIYYTMLYIVRTYMYSKGSLRLLSFSMLVSFIIIIVGNGSKEPIVCLTGAL